MSDTFRYNTEEATKAIDRALEKFYTRRIEKLNLLNLWNVLKQKNPYLFQVYGYETAQEVVENILVAFMSSSDETIFGDIFFEELAIAVSGGRKSTADSVDLEVWDGNSRVTLYAVKSGTKIFNAQSRTRQSQAFQEAINRLRKQVDAVEAVVGYSYGKKRESNRVKTRPRNYREVAGQKFWEEITGDPEFYIKIVDIIGEKPKQHAEIYRKAYASAVNRMSKELLDRFCGESGEINWKGLVEAISGNPTPKTNGIIMRGKT